MTEIIVLDPDEIAENRTELDITSWIKPDGVDWGDSEISAYMSDQMIGSAPVDYRLPNRKIQIPFVLQTRGTVTFDTITGQLQEKAGLLQRESGYLKRQIASNTYFVDVVNATLHLGGGWLQAYSGFDVDASLTLEATPDWYGAPVTLDTVNATGPSASVLQLSSAQADVGGHYPGRVSILVGDTAGQDRHGLLWGFRSRYYSSAATAALMLDAENMTLPTGAALATRAGAFGAGTNNVVQQTLSASAWTDCVVTDLPASGSLTHRGSYRVFARVYGTSGQLMRLLWAVGELATPVVNATATIPLSAGFALVDLGEVRLDANPLGGHKWTGHIQGKGSGTLQVDRILLQPLDEFAGKLVAYVAGGSLEPGQTAPSVLFANRNCLISNSGMFTETSVAGGYMAMSEVYGDLPRIPPSGLENRPVELFVYATRGDFDTVADTGAPTDTMTLSTTYRASYLFRGA